MKGLIEPNIIDDTPCTGLALIEDLGCCARHVFFRTTTIYETGQIVPVVCAKILLPYAAIRPAMEMDGTFIADHVVEAVSNVVRLRLR